MVTGYENWIRYVFAHEYHHTVWGNYWFMLHRGELDNKFIDSLVIDGEADSFAMELYPTLQPQWLFHLSEDDIDTIVKLYMKYGNMNKVSENSTYKLGAVRQVIKEKGISNNASNQKFVIRYDLQGKELGRWGSINECCNHLISTHSLKTKSIKTARKTFLRNRDKEIWLNSKWEVVNDIK